MAMVRLLISRLNTTLNTKRRELEQLQGVNASLRLRLAALQLSWRAQTEALAHQRRAAARLCGRASPEDLAAAEAQLQQLQAHILAALADLGGAAGNAGDIAATLSGVASSRGLPCRLPHLAVDRSIMHLSSASDEDIAHACDLDLKTTLKIWAGLVSEAREVVERAKAARRRSQHAAQAEADLAEVGVRLQRFYILTCIHSFEMFAAAAATNLETSEPAFGTRDAPLMHWEVVVRAARMSTVQALLMIEVHTTYRKRITALHAERGALAELLQNSPSVLAPPATAAATPPPPPAGVGEDSGAAASGAAAGAGAPGPLFFGGAAALGEEAEEQVLALDANTREERAVWQTFAYGSCALFSPAQWARLCVAAFPYPLHAPCCCRVLDYFLKFEPQAFVD